MDFIAILQALKGKVLDAAHFELLKHAYELQDQNIKQLKTNNEALKESNDLLKEKITRLEAEADNLQDSVKALEKNTPKRLALNDYVPSAAAKAILDQYVKNDTTDIYDEQLFRLIRLSKIEVGAGIDELSNHKLINLSAVGPSGASYYLTREGKKFVLERKKEE